MERPVDAQEIAGDPVGCSDLVTDRHIPLLGPQNGVSCGLDRVGLGKVLQPLAFRQHRVGGAAGAMAE